MTAAAKRALRSDLIGARARLSPEDRLARSRALAVRLSELPLFRDAGLLALYAALGAEVDPSFIAEAARARGVRLVYPRLVAGDRRMVFGECWPEALVKGPLGAPEPPADAPVVAAEAIATIVVPGVAFSEDGHRLGRGGGYYDATLLEMPRAARIGVAFDVQVVPTLPREPHDAPLDALVTEARTLVFRRESR
jgi:5-formyltetrahydrofolate cyclo-ligase